jgi:hypothetical protein
VPQTTSKTRFATLVILTITTFGCEKPPKPPAPNTKPASTDAAFRDVAADWQVQHRYRNGAEADRYSILESLGGGVAILDFDADGQTDLVFAGGGQFSGPRTLAPADLGFFRRLGPQRMASIDRTRHHAVPAHYHHGLAAADADNDGFTDLLVTGYGGVQFLRNLGDGTWDDATADAGLLAPDWSSSAAWGDIDNDGALDLYVADYVNWSFDNDPPCYNDQMQREVCSPIAFDGATDRFWTSDGSGRYRDVTQEAGITPGGKGVGVLIADMDLDGDVDIYVANDTTPRKLYENRNGHLNEIGSESGTDLSRQGEAEGSMGADVGDFDLDGLPDLWVANFEKETFALFRNRGHMLFDHVSQETGVASLSREYVGWAVVFFDLDLDGDEDVFVSNGHVERKPLTAPVRQKPVLMRNQAGQRFENVAATAGPYFTQSHPGRGAASGDLDADGDIDLVVSHINEPAAILLNDSPRQGRSLGVRLIGTASNRSAIGAVVRLRCGASTQIRQIKGGGSYASTGDPRLIFGIPNDAAVNDAELDIVWPHGKRETRKIGKAMTRVTIIENGPLVADGLP